MGTSFDLGRGRTARLATSFLTPGAMVGCALAAIGCAKESASGPGAVAQLADPWKRLGPGGGGAQFNPTIRPDDPATALVTSDMTGTFLTRDGGASWTMIMVDGTATSIAFDPVVPTTLYAGTNAGTLLRSTDTGDQWSLVYPHPATIIG